MTYEEYKELITDNHIIPRNQEIQRTKFDRFMEAILSQGIDIANMLSLYHEIFSIDVATGEILDTIGSLVGASRVLQHNIGNVYKLDDENFRTLIRATVVANSWDGTNEQFIELLKSTFYGIYNISYIDNQDSTITIGVEGNITDESFALLENCLALMIPAGVGFSCIRTDITVRTTELVQANIVGIEHVDYLG